MDKNSRSGGGVCFPHDVFDVFLDGLFGNFESVRNFLVRPPLREVFDYRLLSVRELESFFSLVGTELLPPP